MWKRFLQALKHFISTHDDVIRWKHFPRYWPFVRGIHRSPLNSPHKGQWRGALMFSLICAWINTWVNNREAGDYDVIVMHTSILIHKTNCVRPLFPVRRQGARLFRIKVPPFPGQPWRNSYYTDKTASRPFSIYVVNPRTEKMASLCWIVTRFIPCDECSICNNVSGFPCSLTVDQIWLIAFYCFFIQLSQ